MENYEELYRISKILLSEQDDEQTAERLLRRVVDQTGAERAFIVVRDDQGSYEQKFGIGYDRDRVSAEERRFSRTLVREAIATKELIYLPNMAEDETLGGAASVMLMGECSILTAPLQHGGEVYGVVYLEVRRRDGFSAENRAFLAEFAELAGLFIRRALERQALLDRSRTLEGDLFARHDFKGIVARHPRMLEVLRFVAQVADADAPVLIQGETGTGKELVARALHVNSSRRDRPFAIVHCSALPHDLIEAELFGHVAGAFTDAKRDRPGRLASARDSTLLLDEVAEIPLSVQVKLLRFLQFGEIQRVGSDRVEKVPLRIVAATHRDLKKRVRDGEFREDLYFRLKVLDVELPSLRERRSDVPLLVDHFLRLFWRREGEKPRWSGEATRALQAYDYPGNVRELAHLVERACLLAGGASLGTDLLPAELTSDSTTDFQPTSFEEFSRDELKAVRETKINEVEQTFLRALMERSGGNVSRASRESGIHRSYLQKLLSRHRAALGDLTAPAED